MPYYPQVLPRPVLPAGEPSGRLSLTSGLQVMTADVAGAGNVYLTPYKGNRHVLSDGAALYLASFSELVQLLTDVTKSPAAAVPNTTYDTFLWDDAGILRNTRGPAWSSDTVRAAGGAIVFINGYWFNNAAIANGPAAARGTWTGTIRTNAAGLVDWKLGSAALLGGEARLCVWNNYNRLDVPACVQDTTGGWNYPTAVWRAANNSNLNRVSAVIGLIEDGVTAEYTIGSNINPNFTSYVGIGLNSTTALAPKSSTGWGWVNSSANATTLTALFRGYIGQGFNYLQALERGDGAGGGYSGGGQQNFGFFATLRM